MVITIGEFGSLHAIYMAMLETELERLPPLPEGVAQLLSQAESSAAIQTVSPALLSWLDLLDLTMNPHRLRQFGQENGLSEPTTIALLRFLVARKAHSRSDREKVDWLTTQLFKQREQQTKRPTGWIRTEMQQIFAGIPFQPLSSEARALLHEVPTLLEDVQDLERLAQVLEYRIIQRGRDIKNQLGEEFFHPAALAAVIHYNLIFGKKFQYLLSEALRQFQEVDSGTASDRPVDPHELMWADYRTTTEALRQLSHLTQKQEIPKQATARREAPATSPVGLVEQKQLEELGVRCEEEAALLSRWTLELATRLHAEPAVRSLRVSGTSIPLEQGEVVAFQSFSSGTERTLPAEFARRVCHAIALLVRIHEETYAYQKKKGSGANWKKHYNALLYLYYEGRGHKERMLQLAVVAHVRGFSDMAQQLQSTADKLETHLAQLAPLF